MSIEQQLMDRMKEAMKEKRAQELSCIRMVKAAAMKEKVEPGFSGDTGDAFWLSVIAKYVKQQQKALDEYVSLNAGPTQVAELQFEIDYLSPFLPKKMSAEETARLVDEAIAATGADSAKLTGKVMGWIMKSHKDTVDASLVKQLIATKLGG